MVVKPFLKSSTFLLYSYSVDGLLHIQMENMEDSRKETGNDSGPSFYCIRFIVPTFRALRRKFNHIVVTGIRLA